MVSTAGQWLGNIWDAESLLTLAGLSPVWTAQLLANIRAQRGTDTRSDRQEMLANRRRSTVVCPQFTSSRPTIASISQGS
ncbi:MAG: hypothetical protein ACKO8U_12015, partial [Pirellula sp.]